MDAFSLRKLAFRSAESSIMDAEVRERLVQVLLEGRPAVFRNTLQRLCPSLAGKHRLYGVLVPGRDGIIPCMVDETGEPLGPGYIFESGVPIDLLNVEFTPTEVKVKIGNEILRATLEGGKREDL